MIHIHELVVAVCFGADNERGIAQVNHNFPRERGLEKYRPGPQKTFWPTWYVDVNFGTKLQLLKALWHTFRTLTLLV